MLSVYAAPFMLLFLVLLLLLHVDNVKSGESNNSLYISFGDLVGTFDGVPAFSNQRDETNCQDSNYCYKGLYTGIKWQCVEYARRYLIITKGITFGSVDSAFQIPQVNFTTLNGSQEVTMTNDLKMGSLIIWPKDYETEAPHGHVAIVSSVKVDGISVVEQNYDDETFPRFIPWDGLKGATILTAPDTSVSTTLAGVGHNLDASRTDAVFAECGRATSSGRVPASLAYVVYPRGDVLGEVLAYLTLSPIYVGCFYLTLILTRRDVQTALILVGQLFGVVLNYFLKRYIKEPRPLDLSPSSDDYGMPSNHSQFIGYFAGIYCLYLIKISQKRLSIWLKVVYISLLLTYSGLVCYSRVYLKYHSSNQVYIGYLVGVLLAVLWYSIIQGSSKIVNRILEIEFMRRLAHYLKLRNYELVEYASVEETYPSKRE